MLPIMSPRRDDAEISQLKGDGEGEATIRKTAASRQAAVRLYSPAGWTRGGRRAVGNLAGVGRTKTTTSEVAGVTAAAVPEKRLRRSGPEDGHQRAGCQPSSHPR